MSARTTVAVLAVLLVGTARIGPASADEEGPEAAQLKTLDTLRAEVADQIQLLAFDLVDELVFAWTEHPVFGTPTPVVLAGVNAPLGFGSGLAGLVENHFAGLIIKNPTTGVVLAHCPQCSAVVVHSGKEGTVIARGVDLPDALERAGGLAGSRHALFLDFEAEGAALVLRARITSIEPALPIVYAKTLSTSTATPALLREGDHLKSAADAREEYLELLEGQSRYLVPVRIAVRSYAEPDEAQNRIAAPPYVWLQAGVELGLTQARAWTAGFALGYTWAPQSHNGWLAQARISRLLSGRVRSLTQPDLYGFIGASAITLQGRSAVAFRNKPISVQDLLADSKKEEPRATFAAWQLGLELRVKNRISAAVFVEALPTLRRAPSLGSYLDLGIVDFQTLGAEVGFCF